MLCSICYYRRGNFVTIFNAICFRYKRLNLTEHQTQFIEYLLQYKQSYFWFPAFHEGLSTKLSFTAAKVMSRDARVANRSLFGRSDHNVATARFWNITRIISSGFYMANTAVAMCDEVNLYGFWPFYTDHRNRDLQYHYYEPKKFNRKTHHFSKEFRILVDLHMKGVLKLNIDTCRST
ncbi:alpha-2,8-sialyltransferase 8F-like [Anneissia japonica]|uniref:alpha-2,8-sialyltransferase 8F-like n=1 Tax=Anneissia japonica TaxID=1529436 RepID=UPI001425829B|nr:alpha-2,8-sialyltransferase 8F-like [Anneissia japonica]